MEEIKILKAVEEALFDVVMWPEDIWRHVRRSFRPWTVHSYVADQWQKPAEDRFKDGISPLIFWLLICVLPMYLLLDHFAVLAAAHYSFFAGYASLSTPVRFSLVAFALATFPMGVAKAMQRTDTGDKYRDNRRRLFATVCLASSLPSLVLFVMLVLAAVFREHARPVQSWALVLYGVIAVYTYGTIAWREKRGSILVGMETVSACMSKIFFHALLVILVGASVILAAAGAWPSVPHPSPTAAQSPTMLNTPP